MIEKIFEGHPKAVALDIFYPEPESPESDRALAEVFNKYRDRLIVALGFEVEKGKEFKGEVEDVLYEHTILRIENQSRLKSFAFNAHRVLLPPEPIAGSATFGHVNSLSDRDGKLRLENPFIKYSDEYFPSLAIQTARLVRGLTPDEVTIVGGIGVDLGGLLIPTDETHRLHINYLGKERTFIYKSSADVLSGLIPTEFFKDKIVLIGTTAMATYDLKNTPFSANMPGVEKNATVVANIIEENFLKKPRPFVNLLLVLITGLIVIFLCNKLRAFYSITAFVVLTILLIVTNQAVFTYYGLRVNLVYPLFTILTIGVFIMSYRYFLEERSAKNIRRIFSSYVTERVVNELIKNPDLAKLGGERREVTVLFTDIRDFTAFSERHDSEEVVAMLNEYLGTMTDVVFKWEGTLDKFIGDEILVFWGAPLRQDNHAELALRCALDMSDKLDELQQRWKSEGRPMLDAGIGINTGEVIVGNIGAEGKKMDYTVIGDHVNLGSRIEALTKKYNTRILITEFTFNKAVDFVKATKTGHFSVKSMGNVIVKGKEQSIGIYEVKSFASGTKSRIIESEK